MPLDQWIVTTAELIKLHISKGQALWLATLIAGTTLFFGASVWKGLSPWKGTSRDAALSDARSTHDRKQPHDPRQEMTLRDVLHHVGIGEANHSAVEVNVIHHFLCDLRQQLTAGNVGSWGRPHPQYPPDTIRNPPMEPIDGHHWRSCQIFAYEAFKTDPEKVESLPHNALGTRRANEPCYTALRFSREDIQHVLPHGGWSAVLAVARSHKLPTQH